ncbi:hypothetical protein ACIQYF_02150 [Pseudomonas sp. NPDC096917]|uniref:hypothetical protein n=1 Tax=Pseudomonas sp. NPDC096917 TaxID=3364483 RepID=UPI00383B5CBF
MTDEHQSGVHAPLTNEVWTQSWELILPIENTGICSGVSAVEFMGKVHAFFMSEKEPDHLALSYRVFSKRPDNTLIVEKQEDFTYAGLTRLRPAVTVHDGHLFCFNTVLDKTVHYHVFSGTEWSHKGVVPGVLTDTAPAALGFGDTLHLAVQGTYNGELYHKVFHNFEWKSSIKIPGINIKGSPSLALFDNLLHMAITGTNNELYVGALLPERWEFFYRSPYYTVLGSPALSVRGQFLVCASRTLADQHFVTEILREIYDGSGRKEISTHLDRTIGRYLSEPCLISYADQFYLIGQRPCNDLAVSVYRPRVTE